MTQRSWSLIAAACALLSCTKEEPVPPAPGPTGPSESGSNKRDAGSAEEDEDAGTPTGGDDSPISFCTRVRAPAGSTTDDLVGTYLTMPADLTLTRQVERW
ncbi:MAG TPA: hypothetical protein VMF89_26915, partial [Polyangiales bacterium]|nr:hypothetical protein [Polyangiales bacterium]